MMIAAAILQSLILGLLWCGLPAALFVYALLRIGRRIGGKIGLWTGAGIGVALTSAPLLLMLAMFGYAVANGASLVPDYADQYKGLTLLGMALCMVIGVATMLFLVWDDQLARAEGRA